MRVPLNVLGVFRRHHVVGDDEHADPHVDQQGSDRFDERGFAGTDRAADADACDFFQVRCSSCQFMNMRIVALT